MPIDSDSLLARCRFRVSCRARHLRITVSANTGLTVSRPPHVSKAEAAAFLWSRRDWVERQLDRLDTLYHPEPPQVLRLRLTGETVQVRYLESIESTPAHFLRTANTLTLHLDPVRIELGRKAMRTWLKHRARAALEPRLDALSNRLRLPYSRLSVRFQLTRWGSCSKQHNISLNAKLLFLPELLVRHVLIHELVHTVHFNHSSAFWSLVERHDPDWRVHRTALREASTLVPAWLEHN